MEDKQESKQEKLRNFENCLQWANLTQAILKEIKVWDFVDGRKPESTTAL